MPSYLDFDSTKRFRDYILGKTLQQPNGPQTQTSATYQLQNTSDLPNKELGDVIKTSDGFDRGVQLLDVQNTNIFKPLEFFITDTLDSYQRRANLQLYYNGSPYFSMGNHTFISIMSNSNYDTESELFKFAADNMRNNPNGPVFSRISRNIQAATDGKIRLLDALNGNTSTAINILTGREPLIEANNQITVAKTLPGKAIDFLETVAGITAPFSEIPGDYLSNPANPINYRPQASTEVGKLWQDVTGALGSLIGIQRRPKLSRKPSDLMIEYLGQGQKNSLYNTLTFNKYAPNYTTSARSQNSSKLFNFVDRAAQGIKNVLGMEAPAGVAYIGDDRGNDVKYAMNDFNDRPVRSSYYLSLMFDKTAAEVFHQSKNITEGGAIGGKLTWISKNSKNKLGEGNKEWGGESTKLQDSLSTKYGFRDDSILGITQEILNSMPSNGGDSRSHVANVIDQTSRVFGEGDLRISKGSAIKYTTKYSGEESGVEYCRVWTKDRSYMNYSDTMKRTANVRKFDGSVMGGASRVWNLNMAPMSNGNKSFDGSTNIFDKYPYGGGFYAKKYMFSIENLAWKTSNRAGYRVQDLPACERGNNGGRVMWFPPYDLKVSEQNSARWEENSFIGRPEPIFTYQNTSRSGQISFKVVVDHPSILNLLVREHFKGMSDEEADNYINAFFAGCEEIDFYSLIQTYTTLDSSDITLIKQYLNAGKNATTIKKFKYVTDPVTYPKPPVDQNGTDNKPVTFDERLYFPNDFPKSNSSQNTLANMTFADIYNDYKGSQSRFVTNLENDLDELFSISGTTNGKKDITTIFGKEDPTNGGTIAQSTLKQSQVDIITSGFTQLETSYNKLITSLSGLTTDIKNKKVEEVTITVSTSTSEVADNTYNFYLGVRRFHSILRTIFKQIGNGGKYPNIEDEKNWYKKSDLSKFEKSGTDILKKEYKFSDFGYDGVEGKLIFALNTNGEDSSLKNVGGKESINCNQKIYTKQGLKDTAPVAFYCRQGRVKMSYKRLPTKQEIIIPDIPVPKTRLEPDGETTIQNKTPPIDVMKRIIMKPLSECHYFKKLEEDSPVAFSSLKEKLRYFHPAFHSTTPEGLNSRLTFLLQCVRPGDTIPVKGMVDDLDIGARNTSFGPPPICVVRIGDFYHSKVVIRDVNITYEEGVWDLNPEGIGVQPMIANVSLQVNFIGGQGLEKPVERLQNALSSNFFANTEMYDERSEATNTKIGGEDADKFTKTFLEELQKRDGFQLTSKTDSSTANEVTQGVYIGGEPKDNKITYTDEVNMIYSATGAYFNTFQTAYNKIVTEYGTNIASLFFSPTYRTVNGLTINKPSSTETITLLGQYKVSNDLSVLSRGFKSAMDTAIQSTNLTSLFGFDKKMPNAILSNSETLLKPYVKKVVLDKIDKFSEIKSIKELESARNEVISAFDKVNFIVENEVDGKIDKEVYTQVSLSGLTNEAFYKEYSGVVDYIKKQHGDFFEDLENDINFNSPTINSTLLENLLSILLKDEKANIVKLYESDKTLFTDKIREKIGNVFSDFITTPKEKKFKLGKFPVRKNTNEIQFDTYGSTEMTDATRKEKLKKIFTKKNKLEGTLNYYRQ